MVAVRRRGQWGLAAGVALLTLGAAGCYRGHGEPSPEQEGDGGDPGADSDGMDTDDEDPSGAPSVSSSSPGVRLLTPREYKNAVRDLLGVTGDLGQLPGPQLVEGHSQIARGQGVGLDEVERYYEQGLVIAEQALPSLTEGCDPDTLACATTAAEALLPRAFRRPLSPDEVAPYLSILEAPDAGAGVSDRLQTLIATALSSPHFLYRTELGDEPVEAEAHVRRLTDHEIASRLSFLVWQSVPDDALWEAAQREELGDAEIRLQHLERMLDDDRARTGQLGFALDWLGVHGDSTIDDKDPEVLEGTPAELTANAERSLVRTIEDVLFDGANSYLGLLAADQYWVERDVAELLGLEPAADSLEARALDPEIRQGLLMHPAVLAAHTKESGASPFTVGKFVYENILCDKIGPPAEDLPEVDPGEADDQTLRERLEALTAAAECQSCHVKIGPPGFAFLSFDPIGRHALEDGLGRPIDTQGTVPVGDGEVSFATAADLSARLSTNSSTAWCVTRRLYRWTYGHFEAPDTAPYLEQLAATSVDTQADVQALLSAIVASEQFTQVRLGDR